MVLMGVADAAYKFSYIDCGGYGKNSDGGIFASSSLGRALNAGKLHIPNDEPLTGGDALGDMPYAFVADEAFPLMKHVMRPFPGKLQL